SKAAKSLNISYKKAWQMLDAVNKSAKKPVTINSIGGKGGRGAELTEYGKSLVNAFDEINKNCWAFLDTELARIEKL
ncbi:winged helix-turn-helix domain-containing protein, partial [Hyunsoonleella pacifica]